MYNKDFREQTVNMAKELGLGEAAKELKVSKASIHNWIKRIERESKEAEAKSKATRKKYSDGYKRAALKLASKIGPSAATKELGLYKNAIYYWRNTNLNREIAPESNSDYASVVSLRKENAELKRVAETFKEALRLFVKQYDSSSVVSPAAKIDETATGVVHTCKHCGNKYIARVPYQKYCSEQCRVKHYNLHTKGPSFDGIIKKLAAH